MGRDPRMRLDAMKPLIEASVSGRQFQQSSCRGGCADVPFSENDCVLVRNFRPGPKWLNAIVLQRTGSVSYKVQVTMSHKGHTWRGHCGHLSPAPSSTRKAAFKLDDELSSVLLPPFKDRPALTVPTETSATMTAAMAAPITGQVTSAELSPPRYPQRIRKPPDGCVPINCSQVRGGKCCVSVSACYYQRAW